MANLVQLQNQIYNLIQRVNRLQQAVCCSSGTGVVFTEDSDTVTFSGTGTEDDPLTAEAMGGGAGVASFNGRTGAVTLTGVDVTDALGYTPSQVTSGNNFIIAGTNASGNIIDATNQVIQRTLTGFTLGANSTIVAGDTIIGAFGKVQSQLDNKQPLNSELTAFAASAQTGILVRTAANTYVGRTLTGTANLIAISNGNGVGANPVFNVGNLVVQTTATQTLTNKTITSPVLNGVPTTPTATLGTDTTQVASTAFVQQEITDKALLKADVVGGQSVFTADGVTVVHDIVHTLGAIPSYWTITTSEPIANNLLNRTISFVDDSTMRITYNVAPNIGEDANYVYVLFR